MKVSITTSVDDTSVNTQSKNNTFTILTKTLYKLHYYLRC